MNDDSPARGSAPPREEAGESQDLIEVRVGMGWHSGIALALFDVSKLLSFTGRGLLTLHVGVGHIRAVFNRTLVHVDVDRAVTDFVNALTVHGGGLPSTRWLSWEELRHRWPPRCDEPGWSFSEEWRIADNNKQDFS